jgi:hypothetical protein
MTGDLSGTRVNMSNCLYHTLSSMPCAGASWCVGHHMNHWLLLNQSSWPRLLAALLGYSYFQHQADVISKFSEEKSIGKFSIIGWIRINAYYGLIWIHPIICKLKFSAFISNAIDMKSAITSVFVAKSVLPLWNHRLQVKIFEIFSWWNIHQRK